MLLLTQCAACAAPLGLTSGKKCGRCSTRYCGPACQVQHWKEGGHDNICKKIKKAGGAEQYHANQKYTEAVAAAAKKCAEDTKGQTCYICMEAVHRRTGEGLVRGCACGDRDGVASGTTGIAHVSCLVEQAKILLTEAGENNLDGKVMQAGWESWQTCSLCEQHYHGDVVCALGWACWKTYLGRPEEDMFRQMAMNVLGGGLHGARHHEDELSVREAELALHRRLWEEFRDAALDSAMEAFERQKMEDYVRDLFDRVDVSGDGAISVAEAVKACRNDDDFAEAMGFDGRVKIREGWTKEQLIESLAEMDTDGDCSISWDEFRKALLGPWNDDDDVEPPLPPDANVEALESYLRGIFERVDTSGDGAISVSEAASALRDDDEFAEVLGVDVGTDDVFRAIDALDEDGDQRVSWGEFRGAVLGATPWGAE